MRFTETKLPGAFVLEIEKLHDERGYFARWWAAEEFTARGLDGNLSQCSVSFNHRRGTLRGMHFQVAPYAETKIVRCTRGSLFDVMIDLRPGSPTFKQWVGEKLTPDNGKMLYIPKGFAHGFQTLEDNTEISYSISQPYAPHSARGVRWNDPEFKIVWPESVTVTAERDRTYADFDMNIITRLA
jgi:dTDP-4-dehydrorhamnose 3,5-epimerase